ncbi:MAG: hypothetical protein Q8L57_00485 [bacterium]|nr:hypothetical protein [bacterium]
MARDRESIRDLEKNISSKRAAVLSGEMHRLIRKCANNRGEKTAKYFEEALESLKNEVRIASFYITKKWSRQDKCGVDAVVYLLDGTEIKCQIKSSLAGIEKHKKQQEEFGGEKIIVIYGPYLSGETFEEYKERIFRTITESE